MKRSRFSCAQIIGSLKEQEPGMATAEVCQRHGISSATFYKWKSKSVGLKVSKPRRLRSLEKKSSRLKKLLAEVTSARNLEPFKDGKFAPKAVQCPVTEKVPTVSGLHS